MAFLHTFLHTPLGAANPRDPQPIGAAFVEQMEPTGIEPVTSCLQSRTCTPRFPTKCRTSAANYDGASESITVNTRSDVSQQTQKQTQARGVSGEKLYPARSGRIAA